MNDPTDSSPDVIQAECPACGQKVSGPPSFAGQAAECPKCQTSILFKAPSAPKPPTQTHKTPLNVIPYWLDDAGAHITCPTCNAKYNVPHTHGRSITCTYCQAQLSIELPTGHRGADRPPTYGDVSSTVTFCTVVGIIGLVVTVCVFFAGLIEVNDKGGDGSILFATSILVLAASTLSLAAGSALTLLRDIAVNSWYTRQAAVMNKPQ